MIGAYATSALIGVGVYVLLRRNPPKRRLAISFSIFLVLSTLFTVWFIQTGGTYGIMGKNGIDPDWAH